MVLDTVASEFCPSGCRQDGVENGNAIPHGLGCKSVTCKVSYIKMRFYSAFICLSLFSLAFSFSLSCFFFSPLETRLTYISHVISVLLKLCQLFRVDDRHLIL